MYTLYYGTVVPCINGLDSEVHVYINRRLSHSFIRLGLSTVHQPASPASPISSISGTASPNTNCLSPPLGTGVGLLTSHNLSLTLTLPSLPYCVPPHPTHPSPLGHRGCYQVRSIAVLLVAPPTPTPSQIHTPIQLPLSAALVLPFPTLTRSATSIRELGSRPVSPTHFLMRCLFTQPSPHLGSSSLVQYRVPSSSSQVQGQKLIFQKQGDPFPRERDHLRAYPDT